MKAVGAVVVTHNSQEHVAACLQSLSDFGIGEVVVVDSASTDETRVVIASLPVRRMFLSANKGFAVAANVGMATLDTDYVILLNPDAALHSGSLWPAVEYMEENLAVAALGFLLQDTSGAAERDSWGRAVSPLSVGTRHFLKKSAAPNAPQEAGWVSGGAVMLRRRDILDIGGFDESFFLYWEDVDLCRRLRENGKKVVIYPSIVAEHVRGASLSDRAQKTRIYDESADRYFRKHYATSIWLLYRLLRHIYRLFSPQVR